MSSVRLPRIARTASFGLALLYTLLFAVSVAILGTIVYWTVHSTLEQHVTTRINAEVDLLESKFRSEGIEELVEEVRERMESIQGGGHLDYLVVDRDGKKLAGNLPFMPHGIGWSDVVYERPAREAVPEPARVRVIELDNGIRLAVSDGLGLIQDINNAIIGAFGWMLLSFILLTILGGILLSFGFLKRVDVITRTADAIIGGDLGRRIPLRGTNDDLDRLSATLNKMLDRIADLMENLRQVSSDIAHDLRTPLTRLRNKLETAHALVSSNLDHGAAITAAIKETDQILETFSAVLRISQIEAGTRRTSFREVDLSRLFETVANDFDAAVEAESKALITHIQPKLNVVGDRELLTQMLANLIENAIWHTPKGTHIELTLAGTPSGPVASVADDGSGVPAHERERIFRRFVRLEHSRTTPGSGLGLALVAAVADLHGIEISANDNGPGLIVIMKFKQGRSAVPSETAQRRQLAWRPP